MSHCKIFVYIHDDSVRLAHRTADGARQWTAALPAYRRSPGHGVSSRATAGWVDGTAPSEHSRSTTGVPTRVPLRSNRSVPCAASRISKLLRLLATCPGSYAWLFVSR